MLQDPIIKEDYRNVLAGHPGLEWVMKLDAFFQKRERDIETIIKADRCRERWLHGELFFLDPKLIQIDRTPLYEELKPHGKTKKLMRRTAKVDFSVPHPDEKSFPTVVAEIKLVSTDHSSKVFPMRGGGSIHEDINRLRRSALPTSTLHLLIVIIVDEGNTNLGGRLRKGDLLATELFGFGPPDSKEGKVTVRVWMVDPEGPSDVQNPK
jgi:hypothetical protein